MTRILIIETASVKRIREKAENILSAPLYPDPEISILCEEENSHAFSDLPGIKIYALKKASRRRQLDRMGLLRTGFDLVFAFWTGENDYCWWKWLAFRVRAKEKHILAGDGNEFRLTGKACIRHAIFRLNHPLPSDHWDYVRQEREERPTAVREREKILVIQSAEPEYLIQSLDRLEEKPLFRSPIYTVFCRNHPETVEKLRSHPTFPKVVTHSETRGSWRHLLSLRRERFDTVVLFLTGDPSYRKVKLFAFLLGGRRLLVFNEFCDCFFFSWSRFFELLTCRFRVPRNRTANPMWGDSIRFLLSLMLKSVLLPFRFLWLLLIWIRLRVAG